MRALLDENMPGKLRAALSEHDVATVQYIGLGGLKNGELLNAAEAGAFVVAFSLGGAAIVLLGVRATFGLSAAGLLIASVVGFLRMRGVPDAADPIFLDPQSPQSLASVSMGAVERIHNP